MRLPILFAAAPAFGLTGCDGGAPTLHSITPGGSNWVHISFTAGATNGTVGHWGYVEVRKVGTSTWFEAEASNTSSNIKAYQLNEPASGGTAYEVRGRHTCRRGTIDVDDEQTTSPYSNTLVDRLIYYPAGQFPGGGA